MNSIVKRNASVEIFGYPLSDVECDVCGAKMYRVMETVKNFSGTKIKFGGYKCAFCGKEDIIHEKGGVLGNVNK